MNAFDLRGDGRVAFITGGASGLGHAATRVFGEAGYAVAFIDVDRDAGAAAAAALARDGIDALYFPGDVRNADEIDAATEAALARWGRLDVVMNNAAISGCAALIDALDERNLESVLGVDLKGVFLVCRRAVQVQKRLGGGAILNIASITADGSPAYPAYAAAKAGVIALTRGMARHTGRFNIRVNGISPGSISGTNLMEREWAGIPRERRRAMRMSTLKRIPLGRLANPRDIAHVALFLASPLARHVHGTVITVDGGETLGAL